MLSPFMGALYHPFKKKLKDVAAGVFAAPTVAFFVPTSRAGSFVDQELVWMFTKEFTDIEVHLQPYLIDSAQDATGVLLRRAQMFADVYLVVFPASF